MLPTFSEFDELFRSDKAIWLKMLGAAAVTGILAFGAVLKSHQRHAAAERIGAAGEAIVIFGAMTLASIVVLALSIKDIVRRRIDEGRKVNFVLRLLLGMRWLSLAIWCVTITFAVAALAAMTL